MVGAQHVTLTLDVYGDSIPTADWGVANALPGAGCTG